MPFPPLPHHLKLSLTLISIATISTITIFLIPSPTQPSPSSRFNSLLTHPPTPQPLPTPTPAPPSYFLPPATWIPQTFNNCVPATVSMLLQYFGINLDQNQTRLALRTNTDDKNVFTSEIASYLKTTHNLESKLLINGNLDTIKLLIANHIPVIVEAWLRPHEDIGHVLILRGYDDTNQILIADDSYFGVGTKYPYSSFDQFQWQPFNRPYLPVFTPDQLSLAQSIIQDDWDYLTMHQHSAEYNQHLINQTPSNTYAWLNLGSSLYALGHHTAAQQAFETSKSLGWPPRLLWYRIEPIQNANQLGNHQQALELIRIGLTDYSAYPELHFQAAVAYLRLNQPNQARQSLTLALQADPNYQPALDLLAEL